MREKPSAKSKVIEKITFGTKVFVIEKCEESYDEKVISWLDTTYFNKQAWPFILKGNWVKITTKSGNTGYVIDQYLLFIEPFDKSNSSYGLNLEVLRIDTVSKKRIPMDGSSLNLSIRTFFKYGIKSIDESGGSWGFTEIEFEGFTIEEAFVILLSSKSEFIEMTILRNRKDSLMVMEFAFSN